MRGARGDRSGSTLFTPAAQFTARAGGRIVVLEHGRNPSTDYYLRPRLDAARAVETTYVDVSQAPPQCPPSLLTDGTAVIVCRYLPPAWVDLLQEARRRLSAVAYFMDDDLPRVAVDGTLPARYRRRVQRLFEGQKRALSEICDRVWVSTPELARRYPEAAPTVVPPVPIAIDGAAAPEAPVCFYHATGTHAHDARWLRPVIGAVLRRCRDARAEVIIDRRTALLYRGRPRIRVRTSMPWIDYLAEGARRRMAVGLAPLRPTPFNTARAPTKYFDITRCGAVGVYADLPPFAGFVENGRDGVLAGDDRAAWADTVVALLNDPERCRVMHGEACRRCAALARHVLGETPMTVLLAPTAGAAA